MDNDNNSENGDTITKRRVDSRENINEDDNDDYDQEDNEESYSAKN